MKVLSFTRKIQKKQATHPVNFEKAGGLFFYMWITAACGLAMTEEGARNDVESAYASAVTRTTSFTISFTCSIVMFWDLAIISIGTPFE